MGSRTRSRTVSATTIGLGFELVWSSVHTNHLSDPPLALPRIDNQPASKRDDHQGRGPGVRPDARPKWRARLLCRSPGPLRPHHDPGLDLPGPVRLLLQPQARSLAPAGLAPLPILPRQLARLAQPLLRAPAATRGEELDRRRRRPLLRRRRGRRGDGRAVAVWAGPRGVVGAGAAALHLPLPVRVQRPLLGLPPHLRAGRLRLAEQVRRCVPICSCPIGLEWMDCAIAHTAEPTPQPITPVCDPIQARCACWRGRPRTSS
jgi:hypothetical protein